MSAPIVATAKPKLVVKTSRACEQEKRYIFDWVLRDVLGIDFEFVWNTESSFIKISHSELDGTIKVRHDFFSVAEKHWLSPQSLPSSVNELKYIDGLHEKTVSVFDFESKDCDLQLYDLETKRYINFDLFGSVFFLISRYEEAVLEDRDKHDRFPSQASVLSKFEMLDRPIGNEYIELLWSCLKDLWPTLNRTKRNFRVLPSHDIDEPSAYQRTFAKTMRNSLGFFRRGKVTQGIGTWKSRLKYATMTRQKNWQNDPNDTINWIMDQSEEHGLKSAFYYIPEKTHRLDPGMPINHPHVVDQWKRIADRGHEIGLHPGYNTYLWPDRIQSGANNIRQQLEKLKIAQPVLGGRQHYLRWSTPETANAWNDADLDYDSTLAFAERSGFRCGVCYEFPMYDLIGRRHLKLRQRPLVLMDCSVIDDKYMGLGSGETAFDLMSGLKEWCRIYKGDFTVLWHNQRFVHEHEKSLYRDLLNA